MIVDDPILAERFWSRAPEPQNDECQVWRGAPGSNGYGQFGIGKRTYGAHRIAWQLTRGPIPPGMYVCHTCDNPQCVRPSHLFLDTQAGNLRDMDAKGRRRTRHGAAHNRAKLTEYGVPTIHELTRQGLTQRDIAREFGVAQATVNQVLRGKTWKHVARTGAESEMGNGG